MMFSCVTLIVSSWNIIEVIIDGVFVVMAGCEGAVHKIVKLDVTTAVKDSSLTCLFPL